MFAPGTRFLEHLYAWLKQFDPEDRLLALRYVRERLVFISQREMQELAKFLYYDCIVPEILRRIIHEQALTPPGWLEAYRTHFKLYHRKCLFVGLSDGSKIDFFRRHHIDISQEQVIPYYRTPSTEYIDRLREDLRDPAATFWGVFLVDDFTGSGYTLGRRTGAAVKGALSRVYDCHPDLIDAAKAVYVCHYVATHSAREHVKQVCQEMAPYSSKIGCLTALVLPPALSACPSNAAASELERAMQSLCERYYDDTFEDTNTAKAGGIRYGFGGQGLPLVMYSNAPNNSAFPLWYDSRGNPGSKRFRALFRRIPRHRKETK